MCSDDMTSESVSFQDPDKLGNVPPARIKEALYSSSKEHAVYNIKMVYFRKVASTCSGASFGSTAGKKYLEGSTFKT